MTTQFQVEIKKVVAEEVRPLRHAELRKGQDFSTTSYLEDNKESTFHMVCDLESKIVACATFYPEKSTKLNAVNAFRLRGMATDSNFRRKGYARDLMRESFLELKEIGADFVWCNARLGALYFYKSVGFQIIGELFDIEAIGLHYFMYKEI